MAGFGPERRFVAAIRLLSGADRTLRGHREMALMTHSSHCYLSRMLVVCLEGAICLRRLVHLASSHIGRHRTEPEDLVLRDGHEIRGKHQEIRQLSGFDGTLHR